MNLPLAVVSIVFGILAIPTGRRYTGDFFHPAALVVAVWGLSFGAFNLHLMPFKQPGPWANALIVAAVVLLSIGTLAGQWGERHTTDRGSAWSLPAARYWVLLFSILGLLGVVWYTVEVVSLFGWEGFTNFGRVRQALNSYKIPSTFMFLEVFTIVAPLLAFALFLCGTRLRAIDWVAPAACVLSTWLSTGRMQFFLITLTAFFMFVASKGPRLSMRALSLAVAVVGALLLTSFLAIGSLTGKTPSKLPVKMTTAPPQSSTVYLYATGSYAALGQLLRQPLHSPHLTYTLYPAARLLQRLHVIDASLPAPTTPSVGITQSTAGVLKYNVYTFLYDPLMDYGLVGALMYTAVLGLLIGAVYGRFVRRRDSPVRLLLTAEIATALTLSIFANMFSNSQSWYVLAGTVGPFVLTRVWHLRSGKSLVA